MTTNRQRVALVSGASGVVGRRLAEHLAQQPQWRVIGIARHAPDDAGPIEWMALDLTDAAAVQAAAHDFSAVTHIFHCARYAHATTAAEPIEPNLAMLRNLVDATERHSGALEHVHLVQGSKYYGSELGPYKTPAKESDPRVLVGNWYYAQEDWLVERARGKRWSISSSRPHGVCDFELGIVRSMARVLAVYAAISKALGMPLCFPGSEASYRALYQCTDATLLAQAIAWMATESKCAGEAFNVTNGDYIRWMNLWPRFADYFGMACGPVRSVRLVQAMADKAPVWERIVAEHDLAPTPFEQTALWPYGDFILNAGYDIMSDTSKLRRFGFWETVDTGGMFLRLFDRFRRHRIVP
ncbi:MAG: SDR family oxidoreductase [Burkholderiales bacterium]